MTTKTSAPPIPYSVTVQNVREIALRGWADLAFWRERLTPEGLRPAEDAGHAVLHLGATAARFLGIRFQELVICVMLREPEGIYLAHAFNPVRAFAWIERTLFGTPYFPAQIAVEVDAARFAASIAGKPLLLAAMHGHTAEARLAAAPPVDEVWDVPICLPTQSGQRRKVFYAQLAGQTRTVPFDRERDIFAVHDASQHPALGWLAESQFAPRQWIVRPNATHSKSKTTERLAGN
jgi:hypothetical protein